MYICTQCVLKYAHCNTRTAVKDLNRKGHTKIPHVLASICRWKHHANAQVCV